MKISELLRPNSLAENETQQPKPAVIVETERFAKERKEFLDKRLAGKLAKWLEQKRANPLQLLGRLDRVGSYGLNPWNHWHLRYGNTILVHYLALPDMIVLASLSDHRAVDGGTAELASMANYLQGVDVDAFKAQVAKLSQDSAVDSTPPLTPEQHQEASDLIYDLATDSTEKAFLKQAVKQNSLDPIEAWFTVAKLPLVPSAIKEYLKLAAQAIKHTG